MGLGLPRGSKVIVKAGNRQADITLVEQEDGHTWRVQIDRDLPETEYQTLENAILSAETLFRAVIGLSPLTWSLCGQKTTQSQRLASTDL